MPQVRLSIRRKRKRLELTAPLRPPTGRLYSRKGMNPFEVCRMAKRQGINKVVLAFSGGKDSCAGWIALRSAGIEVVPVFKAQFPDLNLDRNTMNFYSNFFGVKVHLILHASFYCIPKTNMFADPVTMRINETLRFWEKPDNDALQEAWKKAHGYEDLPTALCLKKYDSAQRMMSILRKGGEISTDRKTIFPMANASDKMAFEMLVDAKCPLPSFYLENFESRDGLRITTLDWIRKHEKEDWEKIKFWWPLVEAEYYRLGRKPD
jgi:hypothetical protein